LIKSKYCIKAGLPGFISKSCVAARTYLRKSEKNEENVKRAFPEIEMMLRDADAQRFRAAGMTRRDVTSQVSG